MGSLPVSETVCGRLESAPVVHYEGGHFFCIVRTAGYVFEFDAPPELLAAGIYSASLAFARFAAEASSNVVQFPKKKKRKH